MKKMLSFFAFLLVGSMGVAVAQEEVVVAQDSAQIQAPQDSVMIQAPLDSAAVEAVAAPVKKVVVVEEEEEEDLFGDKRKNYGASIAKTWEYRVFGCGNTSSGTSSITSDESAGIEIGVGYNVNSWLYLGGSTGFIHDFGGTSGFAGGDIIPWLVDLQLRWNVKRKVSLFVEGRAGVFCNVTPNEADQTITINGETKKVDFEYPNYVYYDLQPGILFRLTDKLDMRVSFGYGYAKVGKETEGFEGRTYDETILTGKFGFHYRFR